MYESFFGFRERPFDLTPDPHFLVLTDAHREAMSNIEYGIASRKGIILLIGEAGSGKTTVIRSAIERLPEPVHCIHLNNPGLTRPEFVEMLAVQFKLSPRARESKTVLLVELEAFLRARHQARETTVLIVDEAQCLPMNLLEEIRLLANIETNKEKLLSVILAGQPELGNALEDPAASQLKQRVALWCELRRLTLHETAGYMVCRIEAAGGVPTEAFTREAVTMIHAVSKGLPRVINVLADNALLTGLAAETRPVTGQIVQEVCRDFRIGKSHLSQPKTEALSRPAALPASTGGSGSPGAEKPASADTRTIGLYSAPERSLVARMSRRSSS